MKSRELDGRQWGAWVLGLAGFAVCAVLLATQVWADDAAPAARAVRLSSVDGQVQIAQGNEVLADPAVANTPLFEGTVVSTGDEGRAEIQFEDGSVARLSPDSSLTLTVLRGQGGSGEAEIAMQSGLGYFELQGGGQSGTIRVRFADSVVTAGGFTVLRINLDNPAAEVAVFSGNAHLERGTAVTLDLHGGESLALNSTDATRYNLSESIEPDSWDSWNADRDQALTTEAADQTGATKSFADNSNPAWNDLDSNGNWYNVPGQGYIWSPYDAANAGWDPYGNGHWMWTPRFGYIWVSGYPWGYMPYQCGTWNFYDAFGWGWMPGMGGCQTWWGQGGYYPINIGIVPGGYRTLRSPHQPRPRPIPLGGNRVAYAVVDVNRRATGRSTELPARDRTSVVSIGGYTVQALHPLSPRPPYGGSAPGSFVRSAVGNSGLRTGGVPAGGSAPRATGPSYGGGRTGNSSAGPSYGGGQHGSSASHSSYGGASAGGGSVSHSSSGGGFSGGGSASHSSGGGGGGGGGGASHGGGGGGGGGGGSVHH